MTPSVSPPGEASAGHRAPVAISPLHIFRPLNAIREYLMAHRAEYTYDPVEESLVVLTDVGPDCPLDACEGWWYSR